MKLIVCMMLLTFLSGCTGLPDNVSPVKPFNVERYLGKWYEIARLDHSFERDLERVTANYKLKEDGTIDVINSGFSIETGERRQAQGVAKFARDSDEGYLKVSFFGPFYGSYVVFELDQDNYQYAFVSGFNKDYLWLMSRAPTIDAELKDDFIKEARRLGFNVDDLIWVNQSAL